MSTNSRSDLVWELLNDTEALVRHRGFALPVPPKPVTTKGANAGMASAPARAPQAAQPTTTYASQMERWSGQLALGTTWPTGRGPERPLALVISMAALGESEVEFVRSWFENPKVNFKLDEHIYLQPMPVFSSEARPYRDLLEGLCSALAPRAVFCLGVEPARLVLGAPLSLETLRNGDFQIGRWPLLTTLDPVAYNALPTDPPAERQQFKAQVWKDLQRLVGKLRYG